MASATLAGVRTVVTRRFSMVRMKSPQRSLGQASAMRKFRGSGGLLPSASELYRQVHGRLGPWHTPDAGRVNPVDPVLLRSFPHSAGLFRRFRKETATLG